MLSAQLRHRLVLSLLAGAAACASNSGREPSSTDSQIERGMVFRGMDDAKRVCRLEILDVDERGAENRLHVQARFGRRDVSRFWVTHPKTFRIGNEMEDDRAVLRTVGGASGELKIYLDKALNPSFFTLYKPGVPEKVSPRRTCEHLEEVRSKRRLPSSTAEEELL